MTKLSNAKIKWVVRQVVLKGASVVDIAKLYAVTPRRVRQLAARYRNTGQYPTLNPQRRPTTFLSQDQKAAIDAAFDDMKLSPRLLYYELKRRKTPVPKNKLYVYLKAQGKVIPDLKKQKQRKRCRYERKHSGSLVHIDWHRTSIKHPYCILYEDDASRKILAGQEFRSLSAKKAVAVGEEAVQEAAKLNVLIHAINGDHDATFTADDYKDFLAKRGIKMVFSRVKNPQTNGKLERLWREYNKHRWSFSSLQKWIDWYNNRLHGALKLEWAETPTEAFQRKLRPESLLGMMFR
jgi:putative transposase